MVLTGWEDSGATMRQSAKMAKLRGPGNMRWPWAKGRGEIEPLAAIGQFANVDGASGMRGEVPATCGYTRQKCVYDTLARTTTKLGHFVLSVQAYY